MEPPNLQMKIIEKFKIKNYQITDAIHPRIPWENVPDFSMVIDDMQKYVCRMPGRLTGG